ncbi:ABC transporter substrate-binding protein [Spirochaeta cellobiosiphila]|uniref:ABC transporter substrate-binding protein n=1 Tax=Spirochaeta cellobiosiphila TaxID=504483 RepID=UPI000404815E|nr:ABC transporter substrate-binding protein [Spirochaeta cellobiosiphila]
MESFKTTAFILVILLSPFILFGGGQQTQDESESQDQLQFVDGEGSTVPVKLPVDRIVVLNSGLSSLIVSLGQSDKIVGRDSYSTFPSSLKGIPVVGKNSAHPNMERILSLNPQVVLADAMFKDELIAKLQSLGISVLIEQTSAPSLTADMITRYGALLDCRDRAKEIVNYLAKQDKLIADKVNEGQSLYKGKGKIYFELRKDYHSNSRLSTSQQYLDRAGGINIAADREVSVPVLSPEYIVDVDPDIIIRRASGDLSAKTMKELRSSLMRRPGIAKTTAVQQERVFVIKADLFLTDRYPTAIYYIASWLYPEAFADKSPEQYNAEVMDFLFGSGVTNQTAEIYSYP